MNKEQKQWILPGIHHTRKKIQRLRQAAERDFKSFKKHHLTSGLTPVKLREILEDLGPTYVKLGQIMSMRSDMLPEVYCQELTRLRTDVIPMPYETAVSIIESELQRPVSDIFSSIEQTPLGSASIAQVHPAQLKDGTKVVLKVQRPAIQKTMENDIRLLKKLPVF